MNIAYIGVNDPTINLWLSVGLPIGIGLLLVGIIATIVVVRKKKN